MHRDAPDFQRLFRSAAGCCLVLAPDLSIVEVSDAYLRATMTKRDDVVGRSVFAVPPYEGDAAELRASLERVLATKQPDGTSAPVLGADDQLTCIVHEMRTEERYGELLDAAPDAMVVVGEDGRI